LLPLILSVTAAAAILSFRPIYEPDLWWHLAQGRETVSGQLVRTNVFSFTFPDYRQQYTSWLFDVAAFGAWSVAGSVGIQLLQTALLALTLAFLFGACRIRAPSWSAAAVLLLGVFVLEPRAIPRPHLVSFAGMAACALVIERAVATRSARPLAWAVPVVALWSNLHVECVFGVLLMTIVAVAELVWPRALSRRDAFHAVLMAGACGAAALANPYGWGLLAYLYENLSVPQILAIAELRPAYLPDYRAFYLYLGVLAVALLSSPRDLRLWEVAAPIVFATLGVMHLRLTPLVLLVTAPLVAARLVALQKRGIDRRAIVITALVAGLAVSRIPPLVIVANVRAGDHAVEPPQFFSRAAIAFIVREGLEGPVFNSHNLGGYLAWELYPRVRIFQDSRLQAYPSEHFRTIIEASALQREWNALIATVDWAVLSVPRPNQLSGAGRFPEGEWRSVFKDDAVEIVVRR
jgi:hypothetical protein